MYYVLVMCCNQLSTAQRN